MTDKEKILRLVKQHEQYRVYDCINLRADENRTSAEVRNVLCSDLCHRNTSPDPTFVYRGTKYLDELGALTIDLGKKLFRSEYINIWPTTGHNANIAAFFAFCKPGDKVLVLDPRHGGYGGISKDNLPANLGLETIYFPFNCENMEILVDETIKLIESELPALIIFGATYCLFPQPVKELALVAQHHGIPIAYDGAHVMGLIAGGQFQDPLGEGADVLFGSTMKTFGGSPGGILLTNNQEMNIRLSNATWYKAVTAPQWNRIGALGVRFAEMIEKGGEYAKQIIKNARALAKGLDERGVNIMYGTKGYTNSHTILLDVGGLDKNIRAFASEKAARLEKVNIIIDDRGRIGVSEVTSIGMKEKDMDILADIMAKALELGSGVGEVKFAVKKLLENFQ